MSRRVNSDYTLIQLAASGSSHFLIRVVENVKFDVNKEVKTVAVKLELCALREKFHPDLINHKSFLFNLFRWPFLSADPRHRLQAVTNFTRQKSLIVILSRACCLSFFSLDSPPDEQANTGRCATTAEVRPRALSPQHWEKKIIHSLWLKALLTKHPPENVFIYIHVYIF